LPSSYRVNRCQDQDRIAADSRRFYHPSVSAYNDVNLDGSPSVRCFRLVRADRFDLANELYVFHGAYANTMNRNGHNFGVQAQVSMIAIAIRAERNIDARYKQHGGCNYRSGPRIGIYLFDTGRLL
jgi:hypothetical protein